jgi:hypothetical protein
MTFRIESATRGKARVFILSGRIEKAAIAELKRLFELQTDQSDMVLDLKDVGVIHRDVMRFFMHCEEHGVKLENCAPYIANGWREKKIERSRHDSDAVVIQPERPQMTAYHKTSDRRVVMSSATLNSTVTASNTTAPTQFITVGDNSYAYRQFGSGPGAPLLCCSISPARSTIGIRP